MSFGLGNLMYSTGAPIREQKTAKIFYGWWVILVSTIGNTVNFGAIIVFSFGLFILPLHEEFGWSRTEISLAYSLAAVLYAPIQPLVGKLIDRFSARKVIVPSIVFLGLLLMSMYFLTASLWHFYLIYITMGLLGAGTAPPAYVKVISHWFDRKRGFALGLAMSGFGLGALVLPYLTHSLIREFGWRGAYVALGIIIILVTVSVVGLGRQVLPVDGAWSTLLEAEMNFLGRIRRLFRGSGDHPHVLGWCVPRILELAALV